MYISQFWLGVVVTLAAEMVSLVILAIIVAVRREKKDEQS